MAVRERRNVLKLPDEDRTLDWYRRAVDAMQSRPLSDPTSWLYVAAVHDHPDNIKRVGADRFWRKCEHQNWFFLPWHRGYVAAFEAIVARTVVSLGGPDDWALPFWDYSDPAQHSARILPLAFRSRTLDDGAPNALWSRRASAPGGTIELSERDVGLQALAVDHFATTDSISSLGFGGAMTGFSRPTGSVGALENTPHDPVHVTLGGVGGFMSETITAALDPIFWLHHCNIDRLWEVWRNLGRASPKGSTWLNTGFPMHDGAGEAYIFRCSDMLDTTKVLHGYIYEGVDPAREPDLYPSEMVMSTDDTFSFMPPNVEVATAKAELVAVSDGPVQLTNEPTATTLVVEADREARALAKLSRPSPAGVMLALENVTGAGIVGNFDVLVSIGEQSASTFAGTLSTFGIERASDREAAHGGSGLSLLFDITDVIGPQVRLEAAVTIRFERRPIDLATEDGPVGLEAYLVDLQIPSRLEVGRIGLYYR